MSSVSWSQQETNLAVCTTSGDVQVLLLTTKDILDYHGSIYGLKWVWDSGLRRVRLGAKMGTAAGVEMG